MKNKLKTLDKLKIMCYNINIRRKNEK